MDYELLGESVGRGHLLDRNCRGAVLAQTLGHFFVANQISLRTALYLLQGTLVTAMTFKLEVIKTLNSMWNF